MIKPRVDGLGLREVGSDSVVRNPEWMDGA